jgi:hypothetical protein
MGKMDRLLMFHASYYPFASYIASYGSYVILYDRSHRAGGQGTDGASTSGGVR